jgi:NADH-quinone oxidoreductase subunit N
MTSLSTPHLDYWALAPILILLGGALLAVLAESFLPAHLRRVSSIGLAFAAVIISFAALLREHTHTTAKAAIASVTLDQVGIFLQGVILILAFISLIFMAQNEQFVAQAAALPGSNDEALALKAGRFQSEVFSLALFSLAGALLFVVANDFITLFVALEMLSLPLYLMVGLSRRRRLLSQEAALKYFLLGAFASAIFLFGSALLYGFSGSLSLPGINAAISNSNNGSALLILGIILVLVGLLFKTGTAPFHSWVPDVYQGAPTPITAFMASVVKVSAFGAFLRVFYVGFDIANWSWRPFVIAVAIISMFVGAIGVVVQKDAKRILAYSSITHSGFITMAVVALNHLGISSVIFYLFTYGIATVGMFGVTTLIKDSVGEVGDTSRWSGLVKKSPLIAIALAVFLFSLTGIPLTSGFVGKFYLFTAVVYSGYWWLVLVAVIASAIAAFAYLRIVMQIFISDTPANTVSVERPSFFAGLAIAVTAIATIVIGILPSLVTNFSNNFQSFIR